MRPELVAQTRFVECVEIARNLALAAGDAPTARPPVGRQMRPTTHLRLARQSGDREKRLLPVGVLVDLSDFSPRNESSSRLYNHSGAVSN